MTKYIDEASVFTLASYNLKDMFSMYFNTEVETMYEKKDRFIKAGGRMPQSEGEFNCSNVLNNFKEDWWHGKNKAQKIIDMNDNHLVSVMQWLIQNWEKIRAAQLKALYEIRKNNTQYAIDRDIASIEKVIQSYRTGPAYLDMNVRSFSRLAIEVQDRFGNEALRALYDGF